MTMLLQVLLHTQIDESDTGSNRFWSSLTIGKNPNGIRVTESLTDPMGGFRWISNDIRLLELV